MLKLKAWIGSIAIISLSSLWGIQAVEPVKTVVEPVPQVIEKPIVTEPVVPVEEHVVREPVVPYNTSGSVEEGGIHHGDWHDGHHWNHHDGDHWDHHRGDRHHGDGHGHHRHHHSHHHGHEHHGEGHHK